MRKNLTVSLSLDDWHKVRSMARTLQETYSRVFHRLIEGGTAPSCDFKRIQKYRTLLRPHAGFLTERARLFATARRNIRHKP